MFALRIFGFLPALAILFVSQIRAADSSDFKPFTSKEGRFTISFPSKPDESTRTLKSPSGDMELHIFRAWRSTDKELYTLVYKDFPTEAIKSTAPDKILDEAQQGGLAAMDGKLVRKTDVAKTDKAPASRELELETQGTTEYIRLILVGNRLYVIIVDASRGADRARKFLDSFKPAADAVK
jgi:hypothetical protein